MGREREPLSSKLNSPARFGGNLSQADGLMTARRILFFFTYLSNRPQFRETADSGRADDG
jgi:hypothetical protein